MSGVMTQSIRDAAQALVPYEAGLEEGESYDAEDVHDMLDKAHAHYESQLQQRAALAAPQPTASDAVEVLKIVRQYPDFDNGGPLPDAIDSVLRGERPAILDAVDALAHGFTPAPQPTADERVAEHMALVCDYGNARANNVAQGGRFYHEAEQAARDAVAVSARALLSASQEDAEHAAMYRWLRINRGAQMPDGTLVDVYDEHGSLLDGGELDAAIRSAMKEKKA